MATSVYNYNGTLLTTIPDGSIDSTTSLNMPGRGYLNYGEAVNQDMLWIMQNFANSSAPANPVTGQIWYNTTYSSINIYDGTNWLSAGGAVIASTAPTGQSVGTLWFDNINQQLNVWSGTAWLLVGPLGSAINANPIDNNVPLNSVFRAVRIADSSQNLHEVWEIIIAGTLLGIISADTAFVTTKPGFSTIYPGLNLNSNITSNYAPINNPNLTGIPTAPTASTGTNTTQIATTAFVHSSIRTILKSNLVLYVSNSGSDVTGNGTSLSPWATLQHAWNTIISSYDLGGFTISINVANGTYAPVACTGTVVGAGASIGTAAKTGALPVIFIGNTTTPTLCTITSSLGACIYVENNIIGIDGFAFSTTDTTALNSNVGACHNSTVYMNNVSFGANSSSTGVQLVAFDRSAIYIQPFNLLSETSSQYSITAGCHWHVVASTQSSITYSTNTVVTVSSGLAFNTFAVSEYNSLLLVHGLPFTNLNTATGQRWVISNSSDIVTDDNPEFVFPGNTSGINYNNQPLGYTVGQTLPDNVALAPGQNYTVSFTNAATIPLKVSVQQGVYRLTLVINATNTTNSDWYLNPNIISNDPTNGIVDYNNFRQYAIVAVDQELVAFGSATTPAQFTTITGPPSAPFIGVIPYVQYNIVSTFYFDLFGGPYSSDTKNDIGPSIQEFIISTYTNAKMVKQSSGITGGMSSGFSIWNDTSTAWTILGTLFDGHATQITGSAIIERLV